MVANSNSSKCGFMLQLTTSNQGKQCDTHQGLTHTKGRAHMLHYVI